MASVISLEGKVAIVTGGSRGIGEAIARAFVAERRPRRRGVAQGRRGDRRRRSHRQGARGRPHRRDRRPHGQGGATAPASSPRPSRASARSTSSSTTPATNPYFGPMLTGREGAWDKTFEVNLKGYFWCAREVARHCIGRERPRLHRQRRQRRRAHRLAPAGHLRHDEGRGHLDDQDARAELGRLEDPRQRHRPGLRRHASSRAPSSRTTPC